MPGRLVVVCNPKSSRFPIVQRRVFARLDRAGLPYQQYEFGHERYGDAIVHLARFLQPSDTVLVAAGDGTANSVLQAVRQSTAPNVRVGFLAFGNFNDAAHNFGRGLHGFRRYNPLQNPLYVLRNSTIQPIYPLVVERGGETKAALISISLGWTAFVAAEFDSKLRDTLRHSISHLVTSLWHMLLLHRRTARQYQLPAMHRNYRPIHRRETDVLCINSRSFAGIMRTGDSYGVGDTFLLRGFDARSFWRSLPFIVWSVLFGRMRGQAVASCHIAFMNTENEYHVQVDGEPITWLSDQPLVVRKSSRPIMVLCTRKLW
jgi:hypothetical protein